MALDTVLNLLGLIISAGGPLAARLTRQVMLAIFACALFGTTGVASWLACKHEREISRVESQIKAKLAHNRWTLDRIHSEIEDVDYKVLREALSRSIDDGTVAGERTECTVNDGSVLLTRVYYSTPAR